MTHRVPLDKINPPPKKIIHAALRKDALMSARQSRTQSAGRRLGVGACLVPNFIARNDLTRCLRFFPRHEDLKNVSGFKAPRTVPARRRKVEVGVVSSRAQELSDILCRRPIF